MSGDRQVRRRQRPVQGGLDQSGLEDVDGGLGDTQPLISDSSDSNRSSTSGTTTFRYGHVPSRHDRVMTVITYQITTFDSKMSFIYTSKHDHMRSTKS